MGKKDKLYIGANEYKDSFGGKSSSSKHIRTERTATFDRCALSFTPFTTPVCCQCSASGSHVFDLANIFPYIKQHGKCPVSGKPLTNKDLIRLKYHKNASGQYICPITFKVFTPHSHVITIRTSGHVYSREGISPSDTKDMHTGATFTKADVLTLQDPSSAPTQIESKEDTSVKAKPKASSVRHNSAMSRILAQAKEKEDAKKLAAKESGESTSSEKKYYAEYSTGAMAASFTSSAVDVSTVQERSQLSEAQVNQLRYKKVRKSKAKAYVKLNTNIGVFNIELFAFQAPQTVHNFLLLAARKYYDNVIFHRNIKGFMLQGGDPTGTGRGGKSAWGGKFKDEFHPKLTHDRRGILSMANAGSHSNGSQFFITYGPCTHLDNKHSVFGAVMAGDATLDKAEKIPVDEQDRPLHEIKILSVSIIENPFEGEVLTMREERERKEQAAVEEAKKKNATKGQWYSNPVTTTSTAQREGIGKYLPATKSKKRGLDTITREQMDMMAVPSSALYRQKQKKAKLTRAGYGDFSNF